MKIRILMIAVIAFLSAAPVFARGFLSSGWDPPQVRQMYPIKEEIDLSANDFLEFKWSRFDGNIMYRDYYDFRLYKGYATVEDSLILKQRIDPGQYSFRIKADLFQDGEIYTWTIRQVYRAEGKSDRSYSSFKVIKK